MLSPALSHKLLKSDLPLPDPWCVVLGDNLRRIPEDRCDILDRGTSQQELHGACVPEPVRVALLDLGQLEDTA